ncbi:hypothetical protein FRC01_006481 [Tulasnella sp. 417]|nr:hypothetical protein FRC01_006481 [Tulasnella sp. 417]
MSSSGPDPRIWRIISSNWDAKWRSTADEERQSEANSYSLEPIPSSGSLSKDEEDSWTPSQWRTRRQNVSWLPYLLKACTERDSVINPVEERATYWHNQLLAGLELTEVGSIQAWRRRQTAGKELVGIIERDYLGDVIVARRFTKSLDGQRDGLRAILLLCEEEENPTDTSFLGKGGNAFPYDSSHTSYRLMTLIMLYVDRTVFLENIVSDVLICGIDHGCRGILFLATSIPDFFTRVDRVAVYECARRAVTNASRMSLRWFQGIELLYRLFLHRATTKQEESTMLDTGRLILESTMEHCARSCPDSIPVLRVIVWTCWLARNRSILPSILPSQVALYPIFETFIPIFKNSAYGECKGADLAITSNRLKFKLIALLVEQLHSIWGDTFAGTNIRLPCPLSLVRGFSSYGRQWNQFEHLADFCTNILVDPKLWRVSSEEVLGLDPPIPLQLDEEAFNIFCNLEVFPDALKKMVEEQPSRPPQPTDVRLDLLLWICKAPTSPEEARRTLMGSGTCKLISDLCTKSNSQLSIRGWVPKAIWRAKAEAMAYLGRIMEEMSAAELGSEISEALIETVVKIKESDAAPPRRRHQAISMLQKYTAAAYRCGLKPHHSLRED